MKPDEMMMSNVKDGRRVRKSIKLTSDSLPNRAQTQSFIKEQVAHPDCAAREPCG